MCRMHMRGTFPTFIPDQYLRGKLPFCQLKQDISRRQQLCFHCHETISAAWIPCFPWFRIDCTWIFTRSQLHPTAWEGRMAHLLERAESLRGILSTVRMFHLVGKSNSPGQSMRLLAQRCGRASARPVRIMQAARAAVLSTCFTYSTKFVKLLYFM